MQTNSGTAKCILSPKSVAMQTVHTPRVCPCKGDCVNFRWYADIFGITWLHIKDIQTLLSLAQTDLMDETKHIMLCRSHVIRHRHHYNRLFDVITVFTLLFSSFSAFVILIKDNLCMLMHNSMPSLESARWVSRVLCKCISVWHTQLFAQTLIAHT